MPTIVNNDGNLMVQTTSFYEVLDEECVLIEIEGWRPKPDVDVKRDRSGKLATFNVNYQRKPLETRGLGERVLVAHITWRKGENLLVETNSTERDLEIRNKLEGGGGDLRLLRTLGRSAVDLMSEPVPEKDRLRLEREDRDLAANPEVQERIADMFRDYSLRWCDTTIPALGNRKPRTLVRNAGGKAKVLALVEEMESRPQPEGAAGMDFALIRRELDLPGK
ncbi:MAG TPA: hypothetical protein VGR38_00375 [Candidatus Polarisedimenticolia bacterium]|nr:hypothetical protein [Candidatus Polarisedimenticolia bacterium]